MPQPPPTCPLDWLPRRCGILLHPTSLPGPHGCGDLGIEAHRFIDFLAAAGQAWWQMLPVGPPGGAPAFSPYDSASAFAGSPWLVSLRLLAEEGLLTAGDLRPAPGLGLRRVNFGATRRFREARLRQAFARFQRGHGERGPDFRAFCEAQADWLDDFALFLALRRDSGGKPWTDWAPELRARQASALRAARGRLANEVAAHRFAQFVFDRQWRALRQHAQERGIRLIGDLPIFVAQDSADVWCHQELFELDRDGRARKVSGYPPDRFSPKGQLWGHPHYRWAVHRRTGFAWWVQRFARLFELFDAVRVDHFLGFTRTWSIPAGVASPERGRWVESPGEELFSAVRRQLGERPLIAEDLGRVTPADVRLREAFGCAPMRIFQFGFGREQDATDHLPHNYPSLCAAYTGNHDNNTTVGWFRGLPRAQRDRVLAYTGGRAATIHLDSLRAVLQSSANLAICPLQDVFGLDRAARMNTPGTVRGNWRWRLAPRSLTSLAKSLRQRAALFGRLPPP